MPPEGKKPDKLSIIAFSGDFERVHYALAMASAAAATNTPATLFFTMGALAALRRDGADGTPGWYALSPGATGRSPKQREAELASRGAATFKELLDACIELRVKFMVCEMGLRAMAMAPSDLRPDIPYSAGGLVTLLAEASATGQILFI
ncbi:MAG: DsrE family protein [Alphaproteobacteria bacterium]